MAGSGDGGGGLNFFVAWGVIEWAVAGVASMVAGVMAWIWRLGSKIERLSAEVESLTTKTGRLETDIKSLERAVDERYLETSLAREQLKAELLAKIADMPTRTFIEQANNNLISRIDRIVDSRLKGG